MITSPNSPGTRGHRTLAAASLAAAALALTATSCGSQSAGSAPAPVPSATGDPISAQKTSLGTILVDGKGRTVYQFANDTKNTSTCTGVCIASWPYVPAPDPLPTSAPGITGEIGTTTRDDGHRQLTVAGHPLYTFSGDSDPGQTNGQGINLNGGLWTVVSPAGKPLAHPSPVGGGDQNGNPPRY
jgi:predicted lipoprotein with Yx(FWY)xxD motif